MAFVVYFLWQRKYAQTQSTVLMLMLLYYVFDRKSHKLLFCNREINGSLGMKLSCIPAILEVDIQSHMSLEGIEF
jgi:hypothetical protein